MLKVDAKPIIEPVKQQTVQKPVNNPQPTTTEPHSNSRVGENNFFEAAQKFKLQNLVKQLKIDEKTYAKPLGFVNNQGEASEATSGEEAAARLKNEENYIGPEGQHNRARDYQEVINKHKDDPAFLREMYNHLGAEETAKLLADVDKAVRHDNRNQYPNEADVRSDYAEVARSLSHMPDSFQYEVGAQAAKQGNRQAAVVLSQTSGNLAAKRGFLDNIKGDALGDDDYTKSVAARMAGEILSSSPELVKEYLAGGRDASGKWVNPKWSPAEVTKLFKNGLEIPPLGDRYHHDWSMMKGEGLERVVGMAADLKGGDYADFRARVFRDAASVLSKTDTGDDLRQSLVDNLKELFLTDPRGLVDKLFNNTGAANSPYDTTGQALSLFFREALFANPEPEGQFVQTVSKLMGDIRADMLNADNLGKDPNNERYAKLLGDVLGSVAAGYERAFKDNGEDQKANEALVGTVIDLIAKPIEVGGGQVGSMAKDQAKALAKSLFGDLLNGDLEADEAGMRKVLDKLFESAFAGARDFDSRNGTNIEANVKVETIWVDYLKDLFG